MLERWELSNFKSIYEPTTFDLRPLTLFVGANSSGKSTLIQSMLLVAQTITNQTVTRQVVLNGHITRLGSFTDVASSGQDDKPITISFRYAPPSDRNHPSRRFIAEETRSINCQFSFAPWEQAPSKELRALHPKVTACAFNVEGREDKKAYGVNVTLSPKPPEERLAELGIQKEDITADLLTSLEYTVHTSGLPRRSRYIYWETPKSGTPVGIALRHFLPTRMSVRYDQTRELAENTIRYLTATDENETYSHSEYDFEKFATHDLLTRIVEIAEGALPAEKRPRLEKLKENLTPQGVAEFTRRQRPEVRAAYAPHMADLVNEATSGKAEVPMMDYIPLLPEVAYGIQEFFAERFRYLGPLRDEPKAVYPLEGSVDPMHVGLRGEFTAAVLDLYQTRTVTYITPEAFRDKGMAAEPTTGTLATAVRDWLRYLGVVDGIETRDRGVYGHELRVSIQDEALYNLVHVGVGVSQVLPILVMSLLSELGSVLVFEQPELHLHPRVQTLLADFLLSLVATHRQCIVETHSEYMINRLRYRAAADPSDRVHTSFGLYFVEKHGSQSHYRTINVNEYGAIDDWPEGFFDQSPQESERILRAALAKRQERRPSNA